MSLIIPRGRLPDDATHRHAALREYFCDKDAHAELVAGEWHLSLSWPDDRERHVDPILDEGLGWWGQGARAETMALARRREGRVLTALYDSWTLHSWSQWLSAEDGVAPTVTILHVDDHRDLGAPRLRRAAEGWQDLISGSTFNVFAPASVQQAIESGAVGMGSFMTPFLHALPHAQVRHLCQPPKAPMTQDFEIRLITIADDLLMPGAVRPAIELHPADGIGPGHYRITPDLDAWVEAIPSGPILLHIDMDYFNNRYDGDSDWRERAERLDPSPDWIRDRIEAMVAALSSRGLVDRLVDVVVAYSPGFFPAELWQDADVSLRDFLPSLYV